MSGILESLSVRWKVHLPYKYAVLESPVIYFRDRYFRFKCACYTEEVLYLRLVPDVNHIFDPPLIVTFQVEGGIGGCVLPELTQKTHFSKTLLEGPIWDISEIQKVNPAFCLERQLTFLLTFGETDSVTDEISRPCLEGLADDLAKLLDTKSNHDVELHCEGHTTRAHRNILSARSPVLASMFQSGMVESRTGAVNLGDVTNDTLQRLLRFLYIGRLDTLTFDTALRLYEAADMYGVSRLSSTCSKFLISSLTSENASDALVVAELHSNSEFVDAVIGFMVAKKVPMSGDSWRVFSKSHPILANKVYRRFCEMLVEEERKLKE